MNRKSSLRFVAHRLHAAGESAQSLGLHPGKLPVDSAHSWEEKRC